MDATDFVKTLLVPGSTGFLLLGVTLGVILVIVHPRTRRGGVALLSALTLAYWVLALPMTALALQRSLDTGLKPVTSVERGEVVILVFGGGSRTFRARGMETSAPSETTALRALEAARIYHLAGDAWVVASGGPSGDSEQGEPESKIIHELLVDQGVPEDRIIEEPTSSSTREEAVYLAEMLRGMQADEVIAVSSPTHMRRVLGALAAEGVQAVGSPSVEVSETRVAMPWYVPNEQALGDSRQALREMMALVYYAARGWLGPRGSG